MDFSSFLSLGDAFLIAPYRWLDNPELGIWFGTAVLAFYSVLLGEFAYGVIFMLQKKRLFAMQDEVLRYHNLSVDAIHEGNKEAYLAVNRVAHDKFGESFFAMAGAGMTSILPVPFALAWMSLRFEGLTLYQIPFTSLQGGFVFVYLLLYIAERILFGRIKRYLPFFRTIEKVREEARNRRGPAKHF